MNKKAEEINLRLLNVLEAGLEPARANAHKILSLACLPIPPLEHPFKLLHDRTLSVVEVSVVEVRVVECT